MTPNSGKRNPYFYIMQGLSKVAPTRKLRKKTYYLSYLGSFLNLVKRIQIELDYTNVIKQYIAKKNTRKAKLAIYSCITGNYDLPIKLTYLNPEYDYIMFVDNPKVFEGKSYPWEFRKLEFDKLDNVRNARYHKIMAHKVLAEYEKTVWIDSNIDIVSPLLYDDIKKAIDSETNFAISKHPHRDCSYAEAEMCLEMKRDTAEIIHKECEFLRQQGFPEHFGLFETNVMYRTQTPLNTQISEAWMNIITQFSRRDQLALMYSVWFNKAPKPIPMNATSYRNLVGDVLVSKHFKKRTKA